MAKKRYTAEQIISKPREAEVTLATGRPAAKVVRKPGITEQTCYRWRKECGGLRADQANRFKELGRENARHKKVVADLTLDDNIPQEVASSDF